MDIPHVLAVPDVWDGVVCVECSIEPVIGKLYRGATDNIFVCGLCVEAGVTKVPPEALPLTEVSARDK